MYPRAALACAGLLLSGCVSPGAPGTSDWFRARSPRQLLDTALKDARPDERRKAVRDLGRSAAAGSDWAIQAYDAIARTDSDPMVRVEAIRCLGLSWSAATTATLIKLLDSAESPAPGVRLAAPGPVRWEAATVLEVGLARGKIANDDLEYVLSTIIASAERDADRNVRLTALAALRHIRDRRVLPPLLAALRARDFAEQHRAEQSLQALTGQRHDHDPDAWERGLAAAADPFAAPAPASAPSRSWWPPRRTGSGVLSSAKGR